MIREIHSVEELRECAQVIRAAFRTVADEQGLTAENCPTHPAFLAEEQLIAKVQAGMRVLSAMQDGKLVGVVGIQQTGERRYEMMRLAVLPAFRHLGLGRQLVEHVCQTVKTLGGNVVHIGIIDENTVLKQWYLDLGFVICETGRMPHLPFTLCWMEKLMSQ